MACIAAQQQGIPVCALVVVMNVSLIKESPNSAVKLDSVFCGTPAVGICWSPWKEHTWLQLHLKQLVHSASCSLVSVHLSRCRTPTWNLCFSRQHEDSKQPRFRVCVLSLIGGLGYGPVSWGRTYCVRDSCGKSKQNQFLLGISASVWVLPSWPHCQHHCHGDCHLKPYTTFQLNEVLTVYLIPEKMKVDRLDQLSSLRLTSSVWGPCVVTVHLVKSPDRYQCSQRAVCLFS